MGSTINPGEQLVLALYVRDIKKSGSFYRALGFQIARDEETFMELRWEDALLFIVEMEDAPRFPVQPVGNIRILVSDVDEHWNRCMEIGAEILRPIETRSYGLRDFIIAGPDGLSIRFATLLKKGAG